MPPLLKDALPSNEPANARLRGAVAVKAAAEVVESNFVGQVLLSGGVLDVEPVAVAAVRALAADEENDVAIGFRAGALRPKREAARGVAEDAVDEARAGRPAIRARVVGHGRVKRRAAASAGPVGIGTGKLQVAE